MQGRDAFRGRRTFLVRVQLLTATLQRLRRATIEVARRKVRPSVVGRRYNSDPYRNHRSPAGSDFALIRAAQKKTNIQVPKQTMIPYFVLLSIFCPERMPFKHFCGRDCRGMVPEEVSVAVIVRWRPLLLSPVNVSGQKNPAETG